MKRGSFLQKSDCELNLIVVNVKTRPARQGGPGGPCMAYPTSRLMETCHHSIEMLTGRAVSTAV